MTHVVATAGHVDHGKSRLVAALTGIEPDRLAEEQRRGMTIDLGFAWTTLPSGREFAFVDVPGHERFVTTMLAGLGPVRLVVFVVAADEGWKPQSEEHLAICDLLGVEGAVVALTKADAVDGATLSLRTAVIGERLLGTALEHAPVVPCSGATGLGLDALREAIDAMLAHAGAPPDDGAPRLAIDRVFTMRGAGTVVTGTLVDGPLEVGDQLVALPGGDAVRIRSLQSHRREVERAAPVSRVAVNVTGIDRERLRRGDVLAEPGAYRCVDVIDVSLRPVRGRDLPGDRGAYSFHAGTAERTARLRLLDRAAGMARIRLGEPVALVPGDRFVLRDTGRGETIAGGIVLDVAPPARRVADATRRLEQRLAASRAERPAVVVAQLGVVDADDVLPLSGVRPPDGTIAGATPLAGRWWIADDRLHDAVDAACAVLSRFHAEHPIEPGVAALPVRDAIADALGSRRARRTADTGVIDAVIDRAIVVGRIAREGALLRLASHRASAAGREAELDDVVASVIRGMPTPPTIPDLLAAGATRPLLDAAIRDGRLVRVSAEIVLPADAIARAIAFIREAGDHGRSVSEIREHLGTSRRFAVPLVEHLDATGATRREGDRRVARRTDAS